MKGSFKMKTLKELIELLDLKMQKEEDEEQRELYDRILSFLFELLGRRISDKSIDKVENYVPVSQLEVAIVPEPPGVKGGVGSYDEKASKESAKRMVELLKD